MSGPHPSHKTRVSMDASTYDEICVNCGATDEVPGGWGRLAEPCPCPAKLEEQAMPQVSEEEAMEIQSRIEAAARAKGGSANERQVGGTHYRDAAAGGAQQHWDRMWSLYREAWFVGNITKYVERYRRKFGLEDLLKARHYLDKLIELEVAEAAAKGEELPEELQ